MAAFFPSLLFRAQREFLFARLLNWAPGVISIAVALGVAGLLRSVRLGPRAVMAVALIFEVVSNYGIAAAEFLQPLDCARTVGRTVLGRRLDAPLQRRRSDAAALRRAGRAGVHDVRAGHGAAVDFSLSASGHAGRREAFFSRSVSLTCSS